MQSVTSSIWTHVAVSISYDDNDYTTGTSVCICIYIYIYITKASCPDLNLQPGGMQETYPLGHEYGKLRSRRYYTDPRQSVRETLIWGKKLRSDTKILNRMYRYSDSNSPISWVCRIHQLLLCIRVRPPPPTSVLGMKFNSWMVKLY